MTKNKLEKRSFDFAPAFVKTTMGKQDDKGGKKILKQENNQSAGCQDDKGRQYFNEVDTKVDFPKMEERLLSAWYKKGVVKKYLTKNNSSKKYFSFIDGPITANNPMGVHHAWGRTYKDLWQRFKNMQGFKQRFQNGFDCQGLWVEVEVEKELGFKNKKEIEEYGVAKFVQKCRERVLKYSAIQTQQSKRLAYFMDWDNSYFTMSDENNYMIWHFLKVCHENGWLYKGNESVPWCPRCETAISQHEILTEDYKTVGHKSIILEFPIVGKTNEFLLVWTTTPWTIPANIAIAVDKKIEYSLVEGEDGNKFWLASETITQVFGKSKHQVIKKVKGEKLVGLKYKGAFDDLPAVAKVAKKNLNTFHTVVATDERLMPISTEEGTGMVHTAVSAGTEDFRLGKKLGLPMIPVIADDATYLPNLGFLTGKNAKKNPGVILDYLSDEDKKPRVNWVFDIFNYKHRYPCCWRCKQELVWKVTDEWYIAMDKPSKLKIENLKLKKNNKKSSTLRQRTIGVAKKTSWVPKSGFKRELDWLNNMQDWLISKRNRYWGLALPIWECTNKKCGFFEVVGSKEELKKKAISGWGKFEGKTPHKPQIDEVKLGCPKCRGKMSRVEPVGNPWLDAGIVPFSTIVENNKGEPLYKKNREEWEKWFPVDFITEGIDMVRLWFYSLLIMSTVLEEEKPFETVLANEMVSAEDGREMHKSWGNAIEFNDGANKIGVDVMRWMYIRQNPAEKLLFGYKVADEVRRKFILKIWNVYNFFVTYANLDGFQPSRTYNLKLKTQNVLDRWIVVRLDETVLEVTNHLEKYDAHHASVLIEEFVEDLSNWYIRRSRGRVGLVAKSESDKTLFYETTHHILVTLTKLLAPFTPFISEVVYKNLTKEESVHLSEWPHVAKAMRGKPCKTSKFLIQEMELVRKICELGHAERKEKEIPVRQPLQSIKVVSSDVKPNSAMLNLLKDELNIKKVVWKKGKSLSVKLDTIITPELEQEAKTRQLIRKIQNERKKLGFGLKQKVVISNPWLPDNLEFLNEVKRITLAKKFQKGEFGVKKFS